VRAAAKLGLIAAAYAGLAAAAAQPAAKSPSVFRVWTPGMRAPAAPLPLTERAREAANAYDVLADDPALRCVPPGMPAMLDTSRPIELVADGERILMRFEAWNATRVIHMQPGAGPRAGERSPRGASFGRWEGDTLAIFTLYIDYPYFDSLGTPQSAGVTVLERYTPSADGTRLDWRVTVTDDATFTAPVVREGFMAFEPGATLGRHACTPAAAVPAP
jgi:hypothetical protein